MRMRPVSVSRGRPLSEESIGKGIRQRGLFRRAERVVGVRVGAVVGEVDGAGGVPDAVVGDTHKGLDFRDR
jgi:hypothetical protein